MKLHIKKNDVVKVLSGKDKGKEGIVLAVYPKTYTALVQGVNMRTKHIKKKDNEPGKKELKEMPILLNKLMVIDVSSNHTPSRIGRRLNANGKLQRYCIKTKNFI